MISGILVQQCPQKSSGPLAAEVLFCIALLGFSEGAKISSLEAAVRPSPRSSIAQCAVRECRLTAPAPQWECPEAQPSSRPLPRRQATLQVLLELASVVALASAFCLEVRATSASGCQRRLWLSYFAARASNTGALCRRSNTCWD